MEFFQERTPKPKIYFKPKEIFRLNFSDTFFDRMTPALSMPVADGGDNISTTWLVDWNLTTYAVLGISVLWSALSHSRGEALRTFTDSNKKIPAISREGKGGNKKLDGVAPLIADALPAYSTTMHSRLVSKTSWRYSLFAQSGKKALTLIMQFLNHPGF